MIARTASTFDLLPAIDLRGGRVVRLRQGDFAEEDVFADDPIAAATAFAAAGARWLHIVDLDGARAGAPRQAELIARICAGVGERVRCEVGGGLRSEPSVEAVLSAGARRAVLGTAALNDPRMAARLVDRHGPERIAAAIDVRDGRAHGDAWQAAAASRPAIEAVERLMAAGVTTFEVTAIDRDGTLSGPDLDLLRSIVEQGVDVVASAGIRSVADLRSIRALGCAGAIVGRALYDGSLDLVDALEA